MRFIVDAQLPPSWVEILESKGHDSIHTRQLKEGNLTSDHTILDIARAEDRIVITKDTDFYYSFLTVGQPKKLVFVKLGNMRIRTINEYLKSNYHLLIKALNEGSLIEVWPDSIKIIY